MYTKKINRQCTKKKTDNGQKKYKQTKYSKK